jgi:SAM-dependent methyltransferase
MSQAAIDDIYLDGRHFDRLFAGTSPDLGFWLSLAATHGDPILELGCGTGRVAIPLAQRGFRVTGIDRSEAMLQQARTKSAQANANVEWLEADIRDLHLDQAFALIIIPNNTLCHLLDLGDFEACMACVRSHLAPCGRFAIDVFVPKPELLINRPGERLPFSEYDDPDGKGRIVVTESYVYEADTQIRRVRTHTSIPGEDKEVEGRLDLRMYFPQELDALLKYNGFVIKGKYSSYDLRPFDAESEKQLIVCKLAQANA